MEFKEFLNLIREEAVLFLCLLGLVVFGGLFIHKHQNSLYSGSLAINISRTEPQVAREYQYDQFYRLQADEKFGKNIVNWVGDPILISNVQKDFSKIGKGQWSDISNVKTTQLSANYIKVDFKSKAPGSALIFGEALKGRLQEKNKQLNAGEESNWFALVIDETFVAKNQISLSFILVVSVVLGAFAGVFGVLIKYYFFKENENWN